MARNGHYQYFSSLERTIKVSLAMYLFLLIAGTALLLLPGEGIGEAWAEAMNIDNVMMYGSVIAVCALGGLYFAVSKIHWLSEMHIWLDRGFFGFLEQSNEIIFQAMVGVLQPDDQSYVRDLHSEDRYSMIRTVFSRLAENFRLFEALMESGIFRLWIWYWVMNYGLFTFTLLTIGSFAAMLGGNDPLLRPLFTICWSGALLHLSANLILGYILTGMTRKVSESIVLSYKSQITHIFRESISR